jgi:hypothetical protein
MRIANCEMKFATMWPCTFLDGSRGSGSVYDRATIHNSKSCAVIDRAYRCSIAIVAMAFPILIDDVAAGDGAFRT